MNGCAISAPAAYGLHAFVTILVNNLFRMTLPCTLPASTSSAPGLQRSHGMPLRVASKHALHDLRFLHRKTIIRDPKFIYEAKNLLPFHLR